MQSRMTLLGCLLVVACTAGGGCTPPEGQDGQALLPTVTPSIADVPVPVGFELQEDNSRSRSHGTWRTVDYLYEGPADKFAVIRFYEENMPGNRWKPVDRRFSQGRATMNFIKDNESAVVTIYDGQWRSTCVHVDIGPVAPAPTTNKP